MKRWARLALASAWAGSVTVGALGACSSDEAAKAKPHDAGTTTDAADAADAPDATTPSKIGEQTFGPFEPWAKPIEDYLAVGEQVKPGIFNHSINELAPFGDRMFFGYGDADYNLGESIPIEFRYFASKDDPTAAAAPIDATGQGAPQTTPTQSGEEQIDRFRNLDGVLWQAGIDSIDADELYTQAHTDPKGIQGNVYRLSGDTWLKFRSITGGEHVHDVTSWQGAVYAVGSGADTRLEFEAGQIFRYLWRSKDAGKSFETVERVQHPNPGQGDTRWVTLVPTKSKLYLFGYQSDFATQVAKTLNASYDGTQVTNLDTAEPLHNVYAYDALVLPDQSALLWGVDVTTQPVHYTAGRVGDGGTFTPLGALAGSTLLDASLCDTGEVLYLALAGDEYGATPTTFDIRVLVADAATPDTTSEVLHFTTDVEPTSIACWQGALFLGTNDGQVLKATASTPAGG